jgi:acyl carrier protein
MAILEEVKEIITRYVKVEPEKITLESKLNEDLDADSIDIADVVMDIEEKYGFEFSDEDAENIVAIKDLVRVIEERK